MRNSKSFQMFLVILLIVSLFVAIGCSDKVEEKSTPEPKKEAAQKEEPKEEPKEELKWPKKPLQLIIPYSPGGDSDLNSRIIAKYLEKELGQPIVCTNVTGAGGTVATKKLADSKPDGYTFLFHHNTMLLNKVLGITDLSYDNFENAGIFAQDTTNGFYVNAKQSEFKTAQDVIDYAKKHPGELRAASAIANYSHLLYLTFEDKAGVEFNIVDVGGGNDQKTALKAGRVDLFMGTYAVAEPFVKSGDFHPIGIWADERHPQVPDIPTFKEQGIDASFPKSYWLQFPQGTPQEIVTKFTKAVEKVVANEEYRKEIEKSYITPNYMPPEEAVKYIKETEDLYYQYKDKMLSAKEK